MFTMFLDGACESVRQLLASCHCSRTVSVAQELSNILQQIPGMQQREGPPHGKLRGKGKTRHTGSQITAAADSLDQQPTDKQASSLQIFVFSATLTLPQSLRKRLRKGKAWA